MHCPRSCYRHSRRPGCRPRVCAKFAGAFACHECRRAADLTMSPQNVKSSGRFTGRWSYGHPVWAEYPEIGRDLAGRTEELKVASPFYKPEAASSKHAVSADHADDPFGDVELSEDEKSDEEDDNNAIDKILKQKNTVCCLVPQTAYILKLICDIAMCWASRFSSLAWRVCTGCKLRTLSTCSIVCISSRT